MQFIDKSIEDEYKSAIEASGDSTMLGNNFDLSLYTMRSFVAVLRNSFYPLLTGDLISQEV